MVQRRRTNNLRAVATVVMATPTARHYGYTLCRETGIQSGPMYRLLARLEMDGWLTGAPEVDPGRGRPARRYYVVTELGRTEMGSLLPARRPMVEPGGPA